MDKLKPCPFCGGDADLEVFDGRYGPFLYIACSLCDAQSKKFKAFDMDGDFNEKSAQKAAHFWNRREAGE